MGKLITVSENLLEDILPFPDIPEYPEFPFLKLTKSGMAQVVVYQHKKPFIYQDRLLKLQEEAKKNKRGMWSL